MKTLTCVLLTVVLGYGFAFAPQAILLPQVVKVSIDLGVKAIQPKPIKRSPLETKLNNELSAYLAIQRSA